MYPTAGRVDVAGRVGALIEVRAGHRAAAHRPGEHLSHRHADGAEAQGDREPLRRHRRVRGARDRRRPPGQVLLVGNADATRLRASPHTSSRTCCWSTRCSPSAMQRSSSAASSGCARCSTRARHSSSSRTISRRSRPPARTPSGLDGGEVVRDEDERRALAEHVAHPLEAPLLERCVADREHLVDQQHVRLEVRRDGEAEAHLHPGRIELDLRSMASRVPANSTISSKRSRDLAAREPEERPVRIDVLAAGELGGCPRAPRSARRHGPRRRLARPSGTGRRQDLEQGRLPGAVCADQGHDSPGSAGNSISWRTQLQPEAACRGPVERRGRPDLAGTSAVVAPVSFPHPVDAIVPSLNVREPSLEALEQQEAAGEHHQSRGPAGQHRGPVGALAEQHRPPKTVDHRNERVERRVQDQSSPRTGQRSRRRTPPGRRRGRVG